MSGKRLRKVERAFFGTRSRIGDWLAQAGAVRVSPRYRGLRWLSAIALLLLGIQLATGILLSLYYYPEPGAANESTRFLVERAPAGWLARSVHVWAGDLLLLAVVLHVGFAYFRRAYEHPREYEWLVGALVLPAIVAFRFTGSVLPWDTAGYDATRKGLELLEAVPLLGRFTATWLRGGEEMGPNTLSRFFTTHTLILPWLLLALLGAHLYLLRRYGMKEDGE